MKCPACDNTATRVLATKQEVGAVKRSRSCDACRHRWTTTEVDSKLFSSLLRTRSLVQQLATEVGHGAA